MTHHIERAVQPRPTDASTWNPIVEIVKDRIAPALFSQVPSFLLERAVRVRPLVAYYHVVSDHPLPHVSYIYRFRPVAAFEKDLESFLATYRLIGLPDLIDTLRRGRSLPSNALLLTFDDGFREMSEVVAPLLLSRGVPAAFFLTTGFLDNRDMAHDNKISLLIDRLGRAPRSWDLERLRELLLTHGYWQGDLRTSLLQIDHTGREVVTHIAALLGVDFHEFLAREKPYLTSDQVKRLVRLGFGIGAHSVDHPRYELLTREQQLAQTRMSVHWIRERYELTYGAFAFPYGASRVSPSLIREILADDLLDLSFGTAGIRASGHPRHLERFTMENSTNPAPRIVARHYARSLFRAALSTRPARILSGLMP